MPLTDKITMPDGSSISIWHIDESETELRKRYFERVRQEPGTATVADGYKVMRKRKQWFASRLLSYEAIPDFKGIYYDQFGAPHLEEDDRCVSFSHSYDKVAIIIHASHEVGIDIQKQDEKLKRISSKFLNEEETATYESVGRDLDFLHYLWSIKECIFKVHKHHLPFKDIKTNDTFEVEQGETTVIAERFDGPHKHTVHYHKLNGYYLAHSCFKEEE